MIRTSFYTALLSAALILGCDRSDNKPAAPSNPPPSGLPATPSAAAPAPAPAPAVAAEPAPAAPAAPSLSDAVKTEAAAAKADATVAKAEATAAAAQQTEAAKAQTSAVQADLAAAKTALAADAEKKLDEIMTYIKEKKLDVAESTLAAIEKHKAEFSTVLQDKITKARSLLDSAKAGAANLPALPSLGGTSTK